MHEAHVGVISQFIVAPQVIAIVLRAVTGIEKWANPTSMFVSEGRRMFLVWVTNVLRIVYVDVNTVADTRRRRKIHLIWADTPNSRIRSLE